MRRTSAIALVALASLSSCAHHELSPSFREAAAADPGPRDGWYYVCHFEDQAWFCPNSIGLVYPERREAEDKLAEHLRRNSDHRNAARVKRIRIEPPQDGGGR